MGKNTRYTGGNVDWKIYTEDGINFFFPTYAKGAALRVAPKELESVLAQTDPIDATSYYLNGTKQGHITNYLLETNEQQLRLLARQHDKTLDIRKITNKAIISPEEHTLFGTTPAHVVALDEQVDKNYNIRSRRVNLGELNNALTQANRENITLHVEGKQPKIIMPIEQHLTFVDTIQPEIQFYTIPPKIKQLVKDGKGATDDLCRLDIGINLSEGCIANMSPIGWYDPNTNCSYCYAYQNGLPVQTTLYDFTDKEFAEFFMKRIHQMDGEDKERLAKGKISKLRNLAKRNTLNIRLGQNVEVNFPGVIREIPGFVDTLPIVLEYFAKGIKGGFDYRLAMPTKMPEYDKERAKLMKEANLSLLISIGNDSLEKGIVEWGFDTDKRLEEAYKHHEAGVRTTIYIATNIVGGHAARNEYANKAITFAEKHNIPWAELDYRVTKRKDAEIITGMGWDQAKSNAKMFDQGGGWTTSGQGYLIAARTHPDYLEAKNLCSVHVPKDQQKCFKCNLKKAP